MSETRLAVNIDHVATLRQARRCPYPDPVDAARQALAAGARGITAHLRADRRHIQDDDVRRLRRDLEGHLNLELAVTPEMLSLGREVGPDQVTLVPERPEEVTTEGGLDLITWERQVAEAAATLAEAGIAVSLFLDPDPAQLEALERLGTGAVSGFEINTDRYARAAVDGGGAAELEAIRVAARRGAAAGFKVYAGHALTAGNVGPVAAVPEIEELNIGHWLVSRGVFLGLEGAIGEMLTAMRNE